jgi:hypothetical protein
LVGLVAIADRESEREKANPSYKSDWRLCRDNADLVNNFGDITLAHAYCEVESKRLAQYGTPKFPSFASSTFYKGDAYVKTGIATLIERMPSSPMLSGPWSTAPSHAAMT